MQTELFGDEELFLIEGRLSHLQTAYTTENLLGQIQQRAKAKNLAAGAAAAVGDMYGMVANSAALALYDGEDVVNFAGMLGQETVCGTFRNAEWLKEGDKVKAVVSRRGDVLHAHSVLCLRNQLWLLPSMITSGKKALFRHCMSVAFWACFFAWLVMGGIFLYLEITNNEKLSSEKIIFLAVTIFVVPPLMMYPMEIWNYRTFRYSGLYASVIFKLLGVPRPDDFESTKGITTIEDDLTATNFEKALEFHKKKFRIEG